MVTFTAHTHTEDDDETPWVSVFAEGLPEDAVSLGPFDAAFIAYYPLNGVSSSDVLWLNGWRTIGPSAEHEPGNPDWTITPVEPVDLMETLRAAALTYEDAEIVYQRAAQGRHTAIRAAMLSGGSATKIANAAGLSRERVYQIRDGRR